MGPAHAAGVMHSIMLATLAKRFIAESSCTVVMFEASRTRILPNPALPPDRPAPKAAPGTTAPADEVKLSQLRMIRNVNANDSY
jgi:hypothetical protein